MATSLEDVFTLGTIAVYGATALMALFASRAGSIAFFALGRRNRFDVGILRGHKLCRLMELGYPRTFEGLATCYLGALPFFGLSTCGRRRVGSDRLACFRSTEESGRGNKSERRMIWIRIEIERMLPSSRLAS